MITTETGLIVAQGVKLDFADVPEISYEDLESCAATIERHRQNPFLGSFGAFVLRDGYAEDAEKNARRFNSEYVSDKFDTFNAGTDIGLHADDGELNDVTAHFSKDGETDVVILVGGQVFLRNFERKRKVANQLFTTSILDTRHGLVTPPLRALRTTLNKGSIFFFDHTQPHAFKTKSPTRYAQAYYPRGDEESA